ncbi:hypothetical protein EOD41_19390 [Mucilaginibacter limnophilus]|uniref:Leucine-rich repeat domain-containing protein n=1 Tax=Mucilaginibacter limnophilus TaxID=1932778 RepID=A0A3S2UJB5_9SPHI|nr:hypothetical protein [Mucilaginibacter limnophilus]RVT97174.1 hypothetical protein EOD41_19390 [Mucilaginibacter limnophilus]
MLTSQDIKIGIWRFNDGFWPKPFNIEDAEVYRAERLVLDTSTLNPEFNLLSPSKKKELRSAWQKTLPKLINTKYLFIAHQVDQNFFEAICDMPNLEGLYIKWSKVIDISCFENLFKLKHLYFGSTPGLTNLKGIERLSSLISIELENFKSIYDYRALGELTGLESLIITGDINNSRAKMLSLDFLQRLSKLKVLVLDVSLGDKSLEPLFYLKDMVKLYLPDRLYKGYEKQALLNKFPNLQYGDLLDRRA